MKRLQLTIIALLFIMLNGCAMTSEEFRALGEAFSRIGDSGNSMANAFNARANQYRSATHRLQNYNNNSSGSHYYRNTKINTPSTNVANTNDDYMQGHPSYNENYYSPSYNDNDSSPNYDSDYYNKTYNYNDNYNDNSNDAPHGNDIRDYNPYYDRDGNLKQ